MEQQEMERILLEAFPGSSVRAADLTGTGDHWRVEIAAPQFKGLSPVDQHREVYRAYGALMHREIHALSLETRAL